MKAIKNLTQMKKDKNREIKSDSDLDSNEKLKSFLEKELLKIKSTELNLLSRNSKKHYWKKTKD